MDDRPDASDTVEALVAAGLLHADQRATCMELMDAGLDLADAYATLTGQGLHTGTFEGWAPRERPDAVRTLPDLPVAAEAQGRYVAVGELGTGHWGVVEEVVDEHLRRVVARKTLSAYKVARYGTAAQGAPPHPRRPLHPRGPHHGRARPPPHRACA